MKKISITLSLLLTMMLFSAPQIEIARFVNGKHQAVPDSAGLKVNRKSLKKGDLDLVLCGHVHKFGLRVDENGRGECCAGSVSSNGSMVEYMVSAPSQV